MSTQGFDLLGPLPDGTTILEASAGTGKTFTIAALVARYVAEGHATMEQLLVVSFSRASTRELRERVRERLVSARDGLGHPSGGPVDRLLAHLSAVPAAEVAVRRRRLDEALAVFDAATVTTTHGFCQQMLLALGTAGDSDPEATLVEDVTDLVDEVADDLYLRKWGIPGAGHDRMDHAEFRRLARHVTEDPATALLPAGADVQGDPALRVRIATAVRDEFDRRKRRQRLLSYDDMLLRLGKTLSDPEGGETACRRLRDRYSVVLVDEFQDTDPVQWQILRSAFHGHRTLVLIGDPKQAIYAFRGADVHAYLDAAKVAGQAGTLPRNWRSDRRLLAGMDGIFRGAALGDARIRVVDVEAEHTGQMVDVPAPVRLRVVPRDGLRLSQRRLPSVKDVRPLIATDAADQIVDLLAAGTPMRPRGNASTTPDDRTEAADSTRKRPRGDAPPPTEALGSASERPRGDASSRAVEPGDIAVLVRTNDQALLVQSALRAAGVPAVVTGPSSVFSTPATAEWLLLLEALEQPHRTTRVRRLALGHFVGRTAEELDAGGDAYADELATKVRGWVEVLAERGVAALFETVAMAESLSARTLSRPDGERLLTDLRHLTEVLHDEVLREHLGITALAGWLRRRHEDPGHEGSQERSRRLDSDRAAVQVMTVHMSKGLEFPVVLVPFAWDLFRQRDDPTTAVFHDQDRRVRDVGGAGSPNWADHVARHQQEDVDDELRLTYVALTRAQSLLLLWWAPTANTDSSPLHRLLFNDDPAQVPPAALPVPTDPEALAVLNGRAAATGGALVIETVAPRPAAHWTSAAQASDPIALAVFGRDVDTAWRRTSYSALTFGAHDAPRLGSEPEIGQKDDEPDLAEVDTSTTSADDPLRATPSPWDALPGGTGFGTLVHNVLETVADRAYDGSLGDAVSYQIARHAPGTDAVGLTGALGVALATPLGPLADDRTLEEITPADRLAELDFELPLAGGDEPDAAQVWLSDLVPLWRTHAPDGLLCTYPDALAELAPTTLRGYLTGSIDAVLRVGTDAARRYVVVDYKTNRLAGPYEPLTAAHYRPDAMEHAMIDSHYPLQALLYSVALHRYLRWRLRDYDPATHLGGVLYLFLRGMVGPGVRTPDDQAPGVFAWRPPTGLVLATSELMAGRL